MRVRQKEVWRGGIGELIGGRVLKVETLIGRERREPLLGWIVKWPWEFSWSMHKESYEEGGIVSQIMAIWNFKFRISELFHIGCHHGVSENDEGLFHPIQFDIWKGRDSDSMWLSEGLVICGNSISSRKRSFLRWQARGAISDVIRW